MKQACKIFIMGAVITMIGATAHAVGEPGGIATGEWVNKYFVDFDDFQNQTETNPVNVVVGVSKNATSDKIDVKLAPISSIAGTQYTENEAIDINSNNEISVARSANGALGLDGSGASSTLKVNTGDSVTITNNALEVVPNIVQAIRQDTDGVGLAIDTDTMDFVNDVTMPGGKKLSAKVKTYTGDETTIHVDSTSNVISSLVTDTNTKYKEEIDSPVEVIQPSDVNGFGTINIKYDGTTIKKNTSNQLYVDVSAVANGDGNTENACPEGYIRMGTQASGHCFLMLTADTNKDPDNNQPAKITHGGMLTDLVKDTECNGTTACSPSQVP